jgi:hypothetical protein
LGSVCDARGAVNEILNSWNAFPARGFHARCVKISRVTAFYFRRNLILLAVLQFFHLASSVLKIFQL